MPSAAVAFIMFEEILVPTDGSKGAWRGVEEALDIAERCGARLHLIYVIDERRVGPASALSQDGLFVEQVEAHGEEILEETVDRVESRGIEAVTECVRGVPCEAILEYADENEIDLVVMGKHGLATRGTPHIGSTTMRVIHDTDRPVLPI